METETLQEVASNSSMWDLLWSADTVTKVVLIGLILASVWSWAIIFEKFNTLRNVKRLSKLFEERFWSGGSLDKLYDSIGNPQDPMSAMFMAAMKEWRRTNIMKSKTDRGLRGVSLQQRIEKSMMVSMDKEIDELVLAECSEGEYLVDEIMQAARRRFYRPEYIACPGCGRTMYNLESTFEEVKRRTIHLKGMVIAVMGCIVNGPGEMADADWGYVGEGNGKVSIYKGKTPVLKHVDETEAIDKLLELIEGDNF